MPNGHDLALRGLPFTSVALRSPPKRARSTGWLTKEEKERAQEARELWGQEGRAITCELEERLASVRELTASRDEVQLYIPLIRLVSFYNSPKQHKPA